MTFYESDKDDFVTALLTAEIIRALDRHILEHAPRMTPDALREAVWEWCVDRGYCDPDRREPSKPPNRA